jgi:hypothetical protein
MFRYICHERSDGQPNCDLGIFELSKDICAVSMSSSDRITPKELDQGFECAIPAGSVYLCNIPGSSYA